MKYTEKVRCKCGSSTLRKLGDDLYKCLNCGVIFINLTGYKTRKRIYGDYLKLTKMSLMHNI